MATCHQKVPYISSFPAFELFTRNLQHDFTEIKLQLVWLETSGVRLLKSIRMFFGWFPSLLAQTFTKTNTDQSFSIPCNSVSWHLAMLVHSGRE